MTKKEKQEKRAAIGDVMDIGNSRFKDDDVETLYDIASNRDDYSGQSQTVNRSFTDWCSDGKYTRDEADTYTFESDSDGIHINHHYECHDDDGYSRNWDVAVTSARDILNIAKDIFNF